MPKVDVPDRDNDPGPGPIGALRKSVVESLGPRAVHAVEDGFTVGVVSGLALTEAVISVLMLTGLGAIPKRAGPLAILREVSELVRSEDARAQESYFVVGVVVGLVVGVGVGAAVGPFVSVSNPAGVLP
jgi:hypothetical protein